MEVMMDIRKLTKAELITLLGQRGGEVEALRLRVAELEGDVAARDARLAKAEEVWRAMRAAQQAPAAPKAVFEPHVVSTWVDRDGVSWQRVRLAPNRSAIRRVQ